MRTSEILKKIIRITLFTLLPWNVYAEADRFPGAQEQLADGLVNAAAAVDNTSAAVGFMAPAQEASPINQLAMNIPGGNAAGEISGDEVVSQEPASMVSVGSVALEVIDTGTSTHVERPQPAAAAGVDDHQASNYQVMSPATSAAEKNEMTGTVRAESLNISGQTEGVSGEATSGEIVQLPYAVLLAILALMSMIPISRRKG